MVDFVSTVLESLGFKPRDVKSEVEFTAAHEKITLRARADVLALQVDHLSITDGAEVAPVFFLL